MSYPYILKPAKKKVVFPPQQTVIDCGSWKVELAREKMAGSGPPCSTMLHHFPNSLVTLHEEYRD